MAKRSEALRRALPILLSFAALTLLVGCGDDDGPMSGEDAGAELDAGGDAGSTGDGGVDAGEPDAGPPPIAWERCPLFTGLPGEEAECTTVEVPLRHDEPEGARIGIFLKRIVGTGTGQLWLLSGGPGGAGSGFEGYARELQGRSNGLDVYMIDHRGVGGSDRLGCPVQEAEDSEDGIYLSADELAPCLAAVDKTHGETLDAFSTTNAANDVGVLIERLRTPEDRIVVYGLSYGTHWAHRYLHLFPDQADGVILDSICSPRTCTFPTAFARNHDTIGRQVLDLCAADAACLANLSGDPATILSDVLSRLSTGHCPEVEAAGLSPTEVRIALGLLAQTVGLRDAIPAVIRRLDRCDADDVTALRIFADFMQEPPQTFPSAGRGSAMLQLNIVRAELWDDTTPTDTEYQAFFETLIIGNGYHPDSYGAGIDVEPSYAPDAYHETFADTSVPLLMMNGTLDPQTPLSSSDPIGTHFVGPGQTYVVFERAAHFILSSTRRAPDNFFDSCGLDVMEQFMADPTATLDTTCASDPALLDFAGDVSLSRALFGSDDLFLGTSGAPLIMNERMRRLREATRRAFQERRAPIPGPRLP